MSDHLGAKRSRVQTLHSTYRFNGSSGLATVHSTDDKGKDKTETTVLEPSTGPGQNGMIPILLRNLPPGSQTATLSMVVATPQAPGLSSL